MTIDLTPRAGLTALLTGYDETTAAGSSWREQLIVEASELTRTGGWGSITMAKLADRVGVSRQTVYNEIGSKTQLAQALVMHELEMFLRVVDAAFQENSDDLVAAIRVAVRRVLEMGRTNPLLHAVLSASHGAQSDLLPLLTTDSAPLLDAARGMVRAHLDGYDLPNTEAQLDTAVDVVVRVVVSHVMQPSTSPEETAEGIAWMAGRVLSP